MTEEGLVTIAEAASEVGKSAQWLRRHLLAFELRSRQPILVRVGTGEKRPTYKVHMGRLRATCPELFDVRDPIAKALHSRMIVGNRVAQVQAEHGEILEEMNEKLSILVEQGRRAVMGRGHR